MKWIFSACPITNTDGDSGGPFFSTSGGKVIQYGVTSISTFGCGEVGGVQWGGRLSEFKSDIKSLIRKGSVGSFKKMK